MIPIEVTLDRAGRSPYRLTDKASSIRWTTAAMGGFGSCQFTLPGPPPFWKRELSFLGMVRLVLDTQVLWEGQIEDITLSLRDETTTVTALGLQRRLDENSIRKIWSKRDLTWSDVATAKGSATVPLVYKPSLWQITTGAFAPDDLTLMGVEARGLGPNCAVQEESNQVQYISPVALTRIMCDFTQSGLGATMAGIIHSSIDGVTWTTVATVNTNQSLSVALTAGTLYIRIGAYSDNVGTPAPNTTFARFSNIRLLGSTLTEDAAGGFYGGSILNDALTVTGLGTGVIDPGSEFTIESIERSVRSSVRTVVEEVAALYTKEWRVWEDGRFEWKAINIDEPQWIATVADLDSGSEVTSTVDGISKTSIVLFSDASSGLDNEAGSDSTSQQNPYVKQNKSQHTLVSPGFPMTYNTAAQLAARLAQETGAFPPVQGKLVLPATKVIKRASGSPLPAFMIRAGENIAVADMPKTDLFQQGRDGETLFHIVSTEADLAAGSMTLEIEGQTQRTDVLLARLAAATRVLTG